MERSSQRHKYDFARYVKALPAGKPATQTEIRVVAISEEILVEETDHFKHLTAVERGGSIGKQDFLALIELASIRLAGTPSMIQAVGINQMPGLIVTFPI